ncbi:AraC family transcriptional regulator [Saccharicrinis aurantiacus]|uniref:AraC family transcriptional regulator n=1 Tax=Saccharicrinis aurantiacus TaxID=1849719 RepID=UPI00095011F3|nr:AraC family transcriptional regulator [Saccharicrinis aurantiacus]
MSNLHIVEAGYVLPIIDKLRNEGVNIDSYLKVSDLNRYSFNLNSYIPVELMYLLLEEIQKKQDIHFLDFFKDSVSVKDLSDNVQHIIRTPDLLQITQTACKYNHLIMSNELMTLNVDGTKASLMLKVDDRPSLGRELSIKLSMLYTLDGIQIATGNNWEPLEIHFQFKEPQKEDSFIDFGKNINIKYNMPCSGFIFKTVDLTKYKVNKIIEQELVLFDSDLSSRVELLLDSIEPNKLPNLSYFSDVMNMSSRSLIRKLQAEGTEFSSILENWRFKKAIRSIKDESISINELAATLGYANHSNFIRAFNRWTGVSPMKYREL